MTTLDKALRSKLENTIKEARTIAENAATASLKRLGVSESDPPNYLNENERDLRRKLRFHARLLGDKRDVNKKTQAINHLIEEVAYEHWHRMLFARFLAQNNLLMYSRNGTYIHLTLQDCEELAISENANNGFELAARLATKMLPQIFRINSPVFSLNFAPEYQSGLQKLLQALPEDVFTATDSLGWVYQFWQSIRKDEVNNSETKIGPNEISPVTQLFTEPYMVSFLLDNTIGAWFALKRLSKDDLLNATSEDELRDKSKIDGVPLEYLRFVKNDNGQWQPMGGTFEGFADNLKDFKLLDPCCGSGHFLVAAFLMIVPIRMELEKIEIKEAIDSVLSENLHGLEIDSRCVEIAAFNLALTAWKYYDSLGNLDDASKHDNEINVDHNTQPDYRKLPNLNLACCGLEPNFTKDEWKHLFSDKDKIEPALDNLKEIFKNAPILGSLINPTKSIMGMFTNLSELIDNIERSYVNEKNTKENGAKDISKIDNALESTDAPESPATLESTITQEITDTFEVTVQASDLTKALVLLNKKYDFVITNVPYLNSNKQTDALKKFCTENYKEAKKDLATVFLERCLEFCKIGGNVSSVLPQNWLFLSTDKKLRMKLLKNEILNFIARLGPGAFQTPMWDFNVQLFSITHTQNHSNINDEDNADDISLGDVTRSSTSQATVGSISFNDEITSNTGDRFNNGINSNGINSFKHVNTSNADDKSGSAHFIAGLDVSKHKQPSNKAASLKSSEIKLIDQAKQSLNPDYIIALDTLSQHKNSIGDYAYVGYGSKPGQTTRVTRQFWEIFPIDYDYWSLMESTPDGINLFSGKTELCISVEQTEKQNIVGFGIRGSEAWEKNGVIFSKMSALPSAFYLGYFYDDNTYTITPFDKMHVTVFITYIMSKDFPNDLRKYNQKVSVTRKCVDFLPFDLEYWQKVASEKYPNGLPKPYSDDPTQWLFHGHPAKSTNPLQVAVARLIGYQWPAETDKDMELSEEARIWIAKCEDMDICIENSGIVCIPSVLGKEPASDRLMNLLAKAYSNDWNSSKLDEILNPVNNNSSNIEEWLRNKFFAQHCKLFYERPFIWHIWDGLKDGFAALVNYHKLDKKLLETLIYTHLADWINKQQTNKANNIEGSDEKIVAAQNLKNSLESILKGEKPYDIFIRWKSINQQPIGWEPDINDGVRLNIRPFISVPDVKTRGAGVLHDKLKIEWNKDRGKDTDISPWYHVFKGDRINDHHLTLKEKQDARQNINVQKNIQAEILTVEALS